MGSLQELRESAHDFYDHPGRCGFDKACPKCRLQLLEKLESAIGFPLRFDAAGAEM